MFSCEYKCGTVWNIIFIMGGKANRPQDAITIINNVLSILMQIENYLLSKYHFLGSDGIAKKYMANVIEKIKIETE